MMMGVMGEPTAGEYAASESRHNSQQIGYLKQEVERLKSQPRPTDIRVASVNYAMQLFGMSGGGSVGDVLVTAKEFEAYLTEALNG